MENEIKGAIDGILKEMDSKLGYEKRPSDDLPKPKVEPLTTEQKRILNELPDEKGYYWIENNQSGYRTVAKIDRGRTKETIDHWGHIFDATPGGISAIERFLDQHMILSKIEPHKEVNDYEENPNYGMF